MDEFSDCEDVKIGSKFKHKRTIVHIDLDCFYAQVEMLKNPELAMKPVGIKQQHYVITSNYVAREFGVKKCMLITEALAICPKLIIINGEDLHDYRIMSNKVSYIIKQFSKNVERLGLDENFVDVSDLVLEKLNSKKDKFITVGHIYKNEIENDCYCGCRERLTIGSQIASEIRARIKEELGMTCCAGIAHNKLLAKLVGPTHKPNQQTVVFPCAAVSLVSSLSCVRAIPGIGRKTSDLLEALGIDSVRDAQNASLEMLEKHIGKTLAHWIKGACFGVDDSHVKESRKQQVIGLEEAFKQVSKLQEVEIKLNSLIERAIILVEEDGRFPTTIRVSVRKYSQSEEYMRQRETKQCVINPSIFKTSTAKDQIFQIALSLFKNLVDHLKPFHLTLLGLAFTKFQEEVPAKNSLMQFFKKKFEETSDISVTATCCKNQHSTLNKVKDLGKTDSNTLSNDFKTKDVERIDESFLNELPEDIRAEVLESISQHNPLNKFNGESSLKSRDQVTNFSCPLGIDPEVFQELPCEIQLELIKGNSASGNGVTVRSVPKPTMAKRQNPITKYFKK